MKRLFAALIVAALPFSAMAQSVPQICFPDMTKASEIIYQTRSEIRQFVGVAGVDGIVSVYTSEGGSWTITFTRANGTTCVVGLGSDWTLLKKVTPIPEEET